MPGFGDVCLAVLGLELPVHQPMLRNHCGCPSPCLNVPASVAAEAGASCVDRTGLTPGPGARGSV